MSPKENPPSQESTPTEHAESIEYTSSGEYAVYKVIAPWKAHPHISIDLLLEKNPRENGFFYTPQQKDLLSFLYETVQEKNFPNRKDGQLQITHPLNVVYFLQKARADFLTVAVGLLHDYIEDSVDLYQQEKKFSDNEKITALDSYEQRITADFRTELSDYCQKQNQPSETSSTISSTLVSVTELLTRHKRHRYYRSIAEIFRCADPLLKERAIQVKLADRMHNIQCLEIFSEEEMLYQCFKNLFILNNVKSYLLENNLVSRVDIIYSNEKSATEKLFHKCGKATIRAGSRVSRKTVRKITDNPAKFEEMIEDIEDFIFCSHGRYSLATKDNRIVKEWSPEWIHLSNIFNGIVLKYDARLHDDLEDFGRRKEQEIKAYQGFFADYHFLPSQLEAVMDYKDAYALKNIILWMLYSQNYKIDNFQCSHLCSRNRKCLEG